MLTWLTLIDQWIVTVNLTVALPISHLRKFSIHIWGTGLVAAPVVRWLLGSLVACPTPHRLKAVEFVVDLSTDEMQSDYVHDYALWKTVSAALSLEQFRTLQTLRVVVCLRSHPQFRWRTPLTKNDLLPVKEEIEKQFETFSGKREILALEVDTTDAIPKVRAIAFLLEAEANYATTVRMMIVGIMSVST